MRHRWFAGLFLALSLVAGWHTIVLPLAALSHHHAATVRFRFLAVVMVPPAIGLFGTWFWLGPRMAHVFKDEKGKLHVTPGMALIALTGVGIALHLWILAHAKGAGYAQPARHESFTLQMPATVQFGADLITFTQDNGQAYKMTWSEIDAIGLVGGSKDFTPRIEMHWQFEDVNSMRGSVPQAGIDEAVLVEAVRTHFGNKVRDRPVQRFAAELSNPVNANAVAQGSAQFAEWVYTR